MDERAIDGGTVDRKRILFLCTHNSARSQMAEGYMRARFGDRFEVLSAGTRPAEVNPYAVKVMAEVGIDISTQRSKSLDPFIKQEFDYVVTLCDRAKGECPFFAGGKTILHRGFDDPADAEGTEEEIMTVFRRVRDEMGHWIESEFAST